MRRWGSIARRVLLVAGVSGLVGASSAAAVALTVSRDALASQLAPLVVGRFRAADARACESEPERWSLATAMPALRGYAYDGATGTSRNVDAPPLRSDLVATLAPAPGTFAIELDAPWRGGVIVFRTEALPPCDVAQVRWSRPVLQHHSAAMFVGSGIIAAIVASALGLVALVVPLARRLRVLRAAASRVGELDGYTKLGELDDGDELDKLGAILDRAHMRIRADAQLLLEQREALERHLANIAHDLRTPLTSLQVALEYASEATHDASVGEILISALGDTVYLAALTTNLRLASKLRAGWDPAEKVGPTDLAELVTRIATRAQMLARRRHIALAVSVPDGPVHAICNAVAAEQAFSNIVDNAVAHGDTGGHIAVILAIGEDDRSFMLEVHDDGPGMAPRELPRFGERTFGTDEGRTRDSGGPGLGLRISAEVCDRSGWSLRFASVEPRGLLVTIGGALAGEAESRRPTRRDSTKS